MPKSSPEKLAQALRANLKRRKQTQGANKPATPSVSPPESAPQSASKPPKKSA